MGIIDGPVKPPSSHTKWQREKERSSNLAEAMRKILDAESQAGRISSKVGNIAFDALAKYEGKR